MPPVLLVLAEYGGERALLVALMLDTFAETRWLAKLVFVRPTSPEPALSAEATTSAEPQTEA